MSYKVGVSPTFEKRARRLKRKYPSLKKDIEELIDTLEQDPAQGTPIGKSCFKVRLAIRSKGKGKSGGARAITLVIHVDRTVQLLTIYDKSEQESISALELNILIREVLP
ncbi:MAG: hypothetical protein ABI599_14205 [Flavobacteriales bacterium]